MRQCEEVAVASIATAGKHCQWMKDQEDPEPSEAQRSKDMNSNKSDARVPLFPPVPIQPEKQHEQKTRAATNHYLHN